MYEYERRSEGGGRNRSEAFDESTDNEEAGRGFLSSGKPYDSPHQDVRSTSQLFTPKMHNCSSREWLSNLEETATKVNNDATFLDAQSAKINDAVVALFQLSLSPKASSTQRLTIAEM
eukprot:scaffold3453_cov54-Attheya_sp.AAC.4